MDLLSLLSLFVKTSWLLGLAAAFLYIWRNSDSRASSSKASQRLSEYGNNPESIPLDAAPAAPKGCCGGGNLMTECCQATAPSPAANPRQQQEQPPTATTHAAPTTTPITASAPTTTTTIAAAAPLTIKVLYGSAQGTSKQLALDLGQRLSQALASPPPSSTSPTCCRGGDGADSSTEGKDDSCCRNPNVTSTTATSSSSSNHTCCKQQGQRQQAAAAVVSVADLASYEPEQLLSEAAAGSGGAGGGGVVVVVLVSTYEGGTPPQGARFFCSWLDDASTDFRLGAGALSGLRVAVWGCGNSQYEGSYNAVAARVEAQLRRMGAGQFRPLGLGDEDAGDMG
ncbi:hypothetical protein Agub_g5623, partial [Astrephomene gubernaculifera]